jgi:sugar phosphate isomerase/epimerase
MAEKNYIEEIKRILEEYGDQINLIHLCDSTKEKDGLAFGKGEMDMEKTAQVIDNSEFEGTLVLEVMPKDQKEAREKLEEYIN